MKLPQRLEHADALVAALVASHRAAVVPARPMDELLAKLESGNTHALDDTAPSTRGFRPLVGAKTWIAGVLGAAALSSVVLMAMPGRRSSTLPEADGARPGPPAGSPAAAQATSRSIEDLPAASLPSQGVETLPSGVAASPKVAEPSTRPTTRRATTQTRPATSAPAFSLRFELELVEAARRALRGGDGSACLSSVDRYEHEFPSGQFSHEAQVMRIEASALIGSREKAGRLARAFLEANPKSPYAERVRSVLAQVEAP